MASVSIESIPLRIDILTEIIGETSAIRKEGVDGTFSISGSPFVLSPNGLEARQVFIYPNLAYSIRAELRRHYDVALTQIILTDHNVTIGEKYS